MVGSYRTAVALGLCVSVLSAGLLLGTAGCKNKDESESSADQKKSLYERLGAKKGITLVVDDFVNRAAADPAVNFDRKRGNHATTWDATPENVSKLKTRLVEFIAVNTGGGGKYSGKDMATAHTGMGITDAEFNALAGHLKASLDAFKVGPQEQKELLDIIGSTRSQIVGK